MGNCATPASFAYWGVGSVLLNLGGAELNVFDVVCEAV